MYALGMTTRDIQGHLHDMYGVEVSAALISEVTDSIQEEVKAWQDRPLDALYPIVYLDALMVKMRQDGKVDNRAVYTAIGINVEGQKSVLGLWVSGNEGAKDWMSVLQNLKNRGMKDAFVICTDGLKGFPEAIEAVFPSTLVQTCIVHLIRASLSFVNWKERKALAADLKSIYSGGEKLSRHRVQPGELILGDRAYGTARGVYAVRQSEPHVVVRFNPATLRTCDEERQRLFLQEKEAEVPKTGAVEFAILIPVPPKRTKSHKTWLISKAVAWVPARAIASRTRSGEVIWILTTLNAAELPAIAALALYRLRWQIELLFKRLKSLLHLDTLPSRQGPTAKSWMLARLIAAALAQRLVQPSGPLSPWGYQLRAEPASS